MEDCGFKIYDEYRDALIKLGRRIGFNLDLDNPKTIQDKINWMKIYDSTPIKTKCADKIRVHEYCMEKLGKDICVPIISIYDKVEDIKWDELPKQFVIKCNHGSGMNIIVKDKDTLNIDDTNRRLRRFMADDFAFHVGYEMHYHDIPHKIFVEKYIGKQSGDLVDYKFSCFNGVPKILQVMSDRYYGRLRFNYYDMDFKPLNYSRTDHPANYGIADEKPKNFDLMVEYSRKLSGDFKFVRVDFYEVDNKVYLGELTFTPGAGFFKYRNQEDNRTVGRMLILDDNFRLKIDISRNIIAHNCVGARIYQKKNLEYGNPFVWNVIPPDDFNYLYNHYNTINFKNIKLEKIENDYKLLIDGKVSVYYVHYKYDDKVETPIVRNGIDIYSNKIEEYIMDCYFRRLERMWNNPPLFIVTDREFPTKPNFNMKRDTLLKYTDKDDCVIVTCDRTISGKNVFYVPNNKMDPNDIADLILNHKNDE